MLSERGQDRQRNSPDKLLKLERRQKAGLKFHFSLKNFTVFPLKSEVFFDLL